jgi:hypothetical protein
MEKYLYVSGHGTVKEDRSLIKGRIGEDMDMVRENLQPGRLALQFYPPIKANIGSPDRIKRMIKVVGMVNCVPSFEKHNFGFLPGKFFC